MLQAVIMAGGSGTRFWPQSRRQLPKQFLRMTGEETLIQQATSRCEPLISNERIWIVTGIANAVETARQLPFVPANQILVEPCGRNTAPCIGLAAIQMLATDADAVMLVTPADHVIRPTEAFHQAVEQAMDMISEDQSSLVLFGVEPEYPSTGFGYIHRGQRVSTKDYPLYRVQRFHEKPDLQTASRFVTTKNYYWNCGIFVWRAQAILDELKRFSPEIAARLERLRPNVGTNEWEAILELEFPKMPSISIDYAVLEKAADRVYVLEAPFEWDDVGSWQALPRLLPPDQAGNTFDGLTCAVDTEGCIVRSDNQHLIATIGVKNLIIVHTTTATLVADKSDEGSLKRLIAEMETRGLINYL